MKNNNKIIFTVALIILGVIGIWMYSQNSLEEKKVNITKEDTINDVKTQETTKMKKDIMENTEYTTTDSGLQYKVIRMGEGKKPKATDKVEVHYEGKLEDGTVFDSSYARGQKVTFGLNQVIPGWTEGLQLMPVGSEFEFKIPPELAYGDQALPGIPAGSTLIFKVELFEIK